VKELVNDFNELKEDYLKFKEDTSNNIKNILEKLLRKAEKEDLHLLETKMLEKLNDMLQKFLGIFADKKDTVKRLSNLEKNVKH